MCCIVMDHNVVDLHKRSIFMSSGFQLDVFWFIPDHSSVRVDQNIAILGALKRLHAWHGAQISILQVNDHRSSLNDWLSLLEARYIVTSNSIDTTLRDVQNQTVWRGYLKLSEGKVRIISYHSHVSINID